METDETTSHPTTSALVERTLVLIKPDGMQFRDAIIRRIKNAGFVVLQTRTIKLTAEQASEFYRNRSDEPNFSLLVMSLTEGPVQALCVAKTNAIEYMKIMVGPENYDDAKILSPNSLRAIFADNIDELKNAVHVSDNTEDARYEIHYFFPNSKYSLVFIMNFYTNLNIFNSYFGTDTRKRGNKLLSSGFS